MAGLLAAGLAGCSTGPAAPPEADPEAVSRWAGEGEVLEVLRRVEREARVEVQLAPGIQPEELSYGGFLDRLRGRDALEVLAKYNWLRVTEAGEGVLLLVREPEGGGVGSERARQSMRIHVEVEGELNDIEDYDAVAEFVARAKREGGLEVRFAEGVDTSELNWEVTLGSIPWPEYLEVWAKGHGLRITRVKAGVVELSR